MDDSMKRQIERENRREARRMGAGDWSLVLGALVLVAAILGFIYFSDETGVTAMPTSLSPLQARLRPPLRLMTEPLIIRRMTRPPPNAPFLKTGLIDPSFALRSA
jgi:hypothetical protein